MIATTIPAAVTTAPVAVKLIPDRAQTAAFLIALDEDAESFCFQTLDVVGALLPAGATNILSPDDLNMVLAANRAEVSK